MRLIDVVTAVLLCSSLVFGESPSTQPQTTQEADIPRLVKQLGHPLVKKRQEANAALRLLPPSALPKLEEERKQAPSPEIAIELQEIIRKLRAAERGVVIVRVCEDPAAALGMKPGDIITEISGHPVMDMKGWDEITASFRDRQRVLTVRRGQETLTYTVEAGKVGFNGDSFQPEYGPAILAAIQAYNEGNLAVGAEKFEEARKAGLKGAPGQAFELMDAVFTYSRGDVNQAYKLLAHNFAGMEAELGWRGIVADLKRLQPAARHLLVYAAEQQLQQDLSDVDIGLDVCDYLCRSGNQMESMTRTLKILTEQTSDPGDFGRAFGINIVAKCLTEMGLRHEAAGLAPEMLKEDPSMSILDGMAEVAEREGKPELALKLYRKGIMAPEEGLVWLTYSEGCAFRLLLSLGREDEARAMVKAMRPVHVDAFMPQTNGAGLAWPEGRDVVAEVARLAVARDRASQETLDAAAYALAMGGKAEAKEVEAIFERDRRAFAANAEKEGEEPNAAAFLRFHIPLLRGDYGTAVNAPLDPADPDSDSYAAAARFLRDHGAALTGDRAGWKKLFQAYEIAGQGWILVTREYRLGLASEDGTAIREIPRPAERWWMPATSRVADVIHFDNGQDGAGGRSPPGGAAQGGPKWMGTVGGGGAARGIAPVDVGSGSAG